MRPQHPSIRTVMPREEIAPDLSTEEFAEKIAAERAVTLAMKNEVNAPSEVPVTSGAAKAPKTEDTPAPQPSPRSRRGGAFGGALKRRLEQKSATSAEKNSYTSADILALSPIKLGRQLFGHEGDQAYRGVVFTSKEFGAITFAPQTLAKRVGNRVLEGTVDRSPTERLARRDEVVYETLDRQQERVSNCLAELEIDRDVFETLLKEMRSPGYAHMSQDDIDALVAHSEGVYVSMFEAILTNRGMGSERVTSLTAAMYHLLEDVPYKQAFGYRRHLTTLGLDWTRAKIKHLQEVQTSVQNEINERFGRPA